MICETFLDEIGGELHRHIETDDGLYVRPEADVRLNELQTYERWSAFRVSAPDSLRVAVHEDGSVEDEKQHEFTNA